MIYYDVKILIKAHDSFHPDTVYTPVVKNGIFIAKKRRTHKTLEKQVKRNLKFKMKQDSVDFPSISFEAEIKEIKKRPNSDFIISEYDEIVNN